MAKLTDAQIYTLRRMDGGTQYQCRADGKRAREAASAGADRSIPVLLRLGMVTFCTTGPREQGRYYRVMRTAAGIDATWQPVSIEVGK